MGTKTIPTWEEFLATSKEGRKSEWVDGEVTSMTPANFQHELILANLTEILVDYCRANREWKWIPSNAVFTTYAENWRCPDISLVRRSRVTGGDFPKGRAQFAPEVAFEILSPSQTPSEIQSKRRDYMESGVIQVWIDPEKRSIELIEPDQPLRYFQGSQPIVIFRLPGLQVVPEDIFKI
jgi:Uma2 family endonuclease